jgi:hypothetical protein
VPLVSLKHKPELKKKRKLLLLHAVSESLGSVVDSMENSPQLSANPYNVTSRECPENKFHGLLPLTLLKACIVDSLITEGSRSLRIFPDGHPQAHDVPIPICGLEVMASDNTYQ